MASTTPDTPLGLGQGQGPGLLDLPAEILIMLPDFLHNIEDFLNLSSTCRALRKCLDKASPRALLRLAHASSRVFFRPDPLFLVCATARELGRWARASDANEAALVAGMPRGLDHLMELAAGPAQCGLTMRRIRELHALRFSLVNPVCDLVDKCVGAQWYATPDFWNGGVDDAYTVVAEPDELLFDLAVYGELFAPDYDYLFDDPGGESPRRRRLRIDTRLEYVKYCLPDRRIVFRDRDRVPPGSYDPRLELVRHPQGPWVRVAGEKSRSDDNHTLGLMWLMNSTRWQPHWVRARADAGAGPEFSERAWEEPFDRDPVPPLEANHRFWRQRLLVNVMQCQGLEGLGMILGGTEIAERYKPRIREWRDKIERMEEMPAPVRVGDSETHEYPDLWGDIQVCFDGYYLRT
ncbi:hypothetical protein F4811DRAFT_524862 [Daldinia bambusicola]|nr:hypothetical protein F4811DRAFT_524862 [Daldinia bambusicola]